MTDAAKNDDAPDRRAAPRFASRSTARVIRDSDAMRLGIAGKLTDLSPVGAGLLLQAPLPIGEQVKIQLENELQRFKKEVRGAVRHCTPDPAGGYRVGLELFTRLESRELSMLRLSLDAGR